MPVQTAIGRQHFRTEGLGDGTQGCPTGGGQVAGDGIGIDDCGTAIAQDRGDGALAAADATGQAYAQRGCSVHRQGSHKPGRGPNNSSQSPARAR
ncbi:MAG: hypothetical protein ACKOBA_11830, partial [Limnohabitans sp.]